MSIPVARRPLREEIVAPPGYFATELRTGQVLRIVDIVRQRVADFIRCALGERLSVVKTISLNRQVFRVETGPGPSGPAR